LLVDSKRRLPHGEWLPWLVREFHWSERTARNLISAYQFVKSKSAKVADLRLDVSSLYLLAAPSTPQEARAEVLDRIAAGEGFSRTEIKHIVDETKGAQARAHHSSSRISTREAIDRSYYYFYRKLLPFERLKFDARWAKDLEGAIAEGEMKSRLHKKHRFLLHAVEETDAMAKWPVKGIISTIPAEQRPALVEKVKGAIVFCQKVLANLAPQQTSDEAPHLTEMENLTKMVNDARKDRCKKFGGVNAGDILEAIWSGLNPKQSKSLCSARENSAQNLRPPSNAGRKQRDRQRAP